MQPVPLKRVCAIGAVIPKLDQLTNRDTKSRGIIKRRSSNFNDQNPDSDQTFAHTKGKIHLLLTKIGKIALSSYTMVQRCPIYILISAVHPF